MPVLIGTAHDDGMTQLDWIDLEALNFRDSVRLKIEHKTTGVPGQCPTSIRSYDISQMGNRGTPVPSTFVCQPDVRFHTREKL